MPQPVRGDGPWGEAIQYWLNQKKWRQADLWRATSVDKNTVSRAANGLDVNTATLRSIAAALKVSLEDVLVSPDRKSAKEREIQLVHAITEQVYRSVEASRGVPLLIDPVTHDINKEHLDEVRRQIHRKEGRQKRKATTKRSRRMR